jgi:hypothetical protein
MNFYVMKEESDSESTDSFSFHVIFPQQINCDSSIVTLTCVA